ncbi:RES family NAD+ phosphorylase [Stenotrophomonas maltophilia]|nr:RES family NAD+ phosphorylase [Stenotrophomonas maltophilia]
MIKYERRFFFHDAEEDGYDSYAPLSLLQVVADLGDKAGLISTLGVGTKLWRVGVDRRGSAKAADFGPPPPERTLQSNRMNPPGIPMMYLASDVQTALQETRQATARVGRWLVARTLRILDLRTLPHVPGYFSDAERSYSLGILFMRSFCHSIMQPVERDERNNIDYLPSQVATEFFRNFDFTDGRIDGIAYGSTVSTGWNVVLFAGREDVGIASDDPARLPGEPWMCFGGARRARLSAV